MSVLRVSDPAAFARVKADLKRVDVPLRDLNREVQKHGLRVIDGGAAGGDGATERAGPYKVVNGMICHEKDTQSGRVTVPLCNFAARIVSEEVRDDSAERSTVFTIAGTLQGNKPLPPADVPAERLPGHAAESSDGGPVAVSPGLFKIIEQIGLPLPGAVDILNFCGIQKAAQPSLYCRTLPQRRGFFVESAIGKL